MKKETPEMLNDEKAKRLLAYTLRQYSEAIVKEIQDYPEVLPELLAELGMEETEFFERLHNGDNITFYHAALRIVRELTYELHNTRGI